MAVTSECTEMHPACSRTMDGSVQVGAWHHPDAQKTGELSVPGCTAGKGHPLWHCPNCGQTFVMNEIM